MSDAVVITGAGLTTSLGHNTQDVWAALSSGLTGISPSRGSDEKNAGARYHAAVVSGLDPAGLGIHPRDARIMGRHSHMLIKASMDAFSSAGIGTAAVSPEEIGFFAGMGMVDYAVDDLLNSLLKSLRDDNTIDYDLFYGSGYREIYPLWPLSMLNNISFCQAAIGLGIRGENTVFSPHADSGVRAIAEGARTLLEKRAKIVLAGGVSEVVSRMSLARASFFGVLNTEEGEADSPCRPFGTDRRGTVLGEGSGIVCLELRSTADRRGASYTTTISGYGTACDPDGQSCCPSVNGMVSAMSGALECAELGPGDIDLVIAHGDGTPAGDANEAEALRRVFPENQDSPALYSSKAALGHMLAAAPAVDVIVGADIIARCVVPPVAGSYLPEESVRAKLVKAGPLQLRPKKIMINAFSYEGQCSSLIIEAAS